MGSVKRDKVRGVHETASSAAHNGQRFRPIESCGIIGDLHTIALVSTTGSIDWCCFPWFDSPSMFGAILDPDKGGFFKIQAQDFITTRQMYFPDTNILLTRFFTKGGVAEICDFMPVSDNPRTRARHDIVRVVRCVRGRVRFDLECRPAFNYSRTPHDAKREKWGALFTARKELLALHAPFPLRIDKGGAVADFELSAGQSSTVTLVYGRIDADSAVEWSEPDGERLFRETNRFWQSWVSQLKYTGRWRETVTRSALVLKLLSHGPTGALLAAATCSLPESVGGERNWDYRYTWIRDASFTVYALLRLGFTGEASAFAGWLQQRMSDRASDGSLQIVYGLNGERKLTEKILPHWEGYRGSKPLRIGNAAYKQPQMDIYGELMDSIYLYDKYATPVSHALWMDLRRMIEFVCRSWKRKDRGIWEVRSGEKHFVYSKVMCWVAIDRALRLARKRSFPCPFDRWRKSRDAIYEEVMARGYNERIGSFVQHYGTEAVDASCLVFPLVKFISPTDPRMLSTLRRVKERLVSDSLVRRYELTPETNDGVGGSEGTFSMCTFWYAEALARAGQVEDARWVFEKMLGYANHLGLFSEEIGPDGGQLGNFPQAFTHLGLISAAFNIDRALTRRPVADPLTTVERLE